MGGLHMESLLQLNGILARIHVPVNGYVTYSIRGIVGALRGMKHGKHAVRGLCRCSIRRRVFWAYLNKTQELNACD